MTDLSHKPSSSQTWPDLSVVQRWFQAVVTHPSGIDAGVESHEALELMPMTRHGLEQMVTRSEKLSARARLSIYANAYYARLLECLGDSYPVLKRTLGEEAFNAFAFGYLQKYPSRSYTLGKLGERFPEYLAETRPDIDKATSSVIQGTVSWPDFLIDLARLERTIAEVFDGPGIEKTAVLSTEQLGGITPDKWMVVRLRTVPCLRLLAVQYPLNEYYSAVRQSPDESTIPLPTPAESHIAVTRRDYIVRRHDLSHSQYLILNALKEGRTLGDSIASVTDCCDFTDEELESELRQWFKNWICQQFFDSIILPSG
ncbi:MAG: putative DNA-binding domain-containing protein [Candidatus Hydrogenedentes bacterium]|nr:putative DNA-binding domain-containing protein [Candidatus Hydrogenedentota bacterium]